MAYINTYTKEEQKALAVEKVRQTLAKINTDVISVFDSDVFSDYLDFVARFHHYDVYNTMLVYKQQPTATFLASFKAWEQFSFECWGDANRPVFASSQKGKGIGILAPYILKRKIEGSSPSGQKGVSYFDYHVVFVFDKDQTNNIPVPFLPWDLSNSKEDSMALFNALKEKAPFHVVFEGKERSFRFMYKPTDRPDEKGTLILNYSDIERQHVLCSYVIKNYVLCSMRNKLKSLSEDELQKTCECISYVMSKYFGLPADKDAFFYVRIWGQNNTRKMLNILNRVQKYAHLFIEELEEEMVFQKSMSSIEDVYDDDEIFDTDDFYIF